MFLNIEGAQSFAANVQKNQLLRIKFEVDVEPATSFASETKTLLLPSPFTVKALTLPCLFAGKMHAVLFRKWKLRVKGRDFYDLVWYLTRKVPLNRAYLQEKIQGTQELLQPLNKAILLELFQDRVRSIDWSKARQDVYPFIKDRRQVDLWSAEFFLNMIDSVEFEK